MFRKGRRRLGPSACSMARAFCTTAAPHSCRVSCATWHPGTAGVHTAPTSPNPSPVRDACAPMLAVARPVIGRTYYVGTYSAQYGMVAGELHAPSLPGELPSLLPATYPRLFARSEPIPLLHLRHRAANWPHTEITDGTARTHADGCCDRLDTGCCTAYVAGGTRGTVQRCGGT